MVVEICIVYYIKINYMFRPFSLAIFRLIIEKKLSKQLQLTCVGCIQWGDKRWNGYEILHVLCRMGGVGTWVLLAEPMYPHHPSYTTCEISFPLHILTTHCIQPTQVKCSCLLSFLQLSTWRWPIKRPETCSWSLCNKLYIFLPPYSCVRQVYTLQSSLWYGVFYMHQYKQSCR